MLRHQARVARKEQLRVRRAQDVAHAVLRAEGRAVSFHIHALPAVVGGDRLDFDAADGKFLPRPDDALRLSADLRKRPRARGGAVKRRARQRTSVSSFSFQTSAVRCSAPDARSCVFMLPHPRLFVILEAF